MRALPTDHGGDLLYDPTPLPPAALVPAGWLTTVRAYYLDTEAIGQSILDSLSRGLGISECVFREAFDDGISTLRLLHGDHLWATTTRFPENHGLGYLRPPRAAYADPLQSG